MTNPNPARGWLRLCNPLATRRPPSPGSTPEVVLSTPPLPTLLINDDWPQTARVGRIAISTTDGVLRETIELASPNRQDPDFMVFLAHPNRLYVRPRYGLPHVGEWLPDMPTREVAEAEHRIGHRIRKAQR
ncbi:hypothetical protein J1770_gp78 [Gordonia phage EMoore]|uniref:Uncharacterized protein n=1 Tax=Gordonia phage EMoore TaxID=2656534 RepID=A0A649VWA1_9CAUD|nr:hypothetical protein J1770_gp78 [Gordonia phage EMoore]QGJ95863.1 hypothetical protein SEA_EMOORE_78 [Gordonia phage EMoore]